MIDDLRTLPAGTTIAADLCLIGGGAAGITIARELAGSKVRVCLVEGGGFEYEEETQALYDGRSSGAPVALQGGRLRLLGGSTHHWGGRCAQLEELDLRRRDWVPHSGWPLRRAELEPYYVRARTMAGFAAPWLTDAATLGALGVTLPGINEQWLRPFLWRYTPASPGSGAWDFATAYRPALQLAGNVQVLLHANFKAFAATDDRSRVHALTVGALGGPSATILARDYVLCCGGIENARLLLLGAEQNGGGFGNAHDNVGRFFMQHTRGPTGVLQSDGRLTRLQGQFNILRGADGLQTEVGLALAPALQEAEGLLNASAALQYLGDPDSGIAAAQDIWRALLDGHWAQDMGEKTAHIAADAGELARAVRHRLAAGHSLSAEGAEGVPSRSASIVLDLEQAPDPQSRITLDTERDAMGLRRVRADWRLGELERRTAARFTSLIGAEFARLGIARCRLEPWLQDQRAPLTDAMKETYHHIGTTRMADDPRDGVVDRNGAVHGMRNLYVAGSSIFPTGGQANPTLTIVALALRLADRLRPAAS